MAFVIIMILFYNYLLIYLFITRDVVTQILIILYILFDVCDLNKYLL